MGAELVEMAIVLGWFVLLVLSMLEMMMLLYAYNTTGALSRDALRYAIVRGDRAALDSSRSTGSPPDAPATNPSIQSFINSQTIHSGQFTVEAIWPDENSKAIGAPVEITVTHVYEPVVFPFSSLFDRTLQSTARGVILY